MTGAAFGPGSAIAQDASFGCKVLLCAAATAPGWSGIPYCVPVMQQLFRSLAHGGSWPTCPEGNAGRLGFEPYFPCPGGTTPMQRTGGDSDALVPAPNGDRCADTSKPRRGCHSGDDGSCETTYPTTPRQARTEPNYVDISTANGAQR
ncbi:MAG TPA: hypothetical protein VFF19_13060, partial [Reyranella sp.]|nr:hypothetical protein [Reyranella sp.]